MDTTDGLVRGEKAVDTGSPIAMPVGPETLGRILIALAWPAFAVGWVLIFFGIMRELSASILLYAPGTEVLSVVMLKMWVSGKPEEVSVIGLVMLVLVLVFRWVQLRFIKRRISTL